MTHAVRMQVVALLESASDGNRDREFELAYAARLAIERIRFAIHQIDDVGLANERLREATFQLMDAVDRLQSADRRFQCLSKFRAREV